VKTVKPVPALLFVACIILTLCDGSTLHRADQPRPAAAKSLSLDLRSEYRPVPVRVPTPRDPLEVRSVEIRAQLREDGSGDGLMRLDTRPATLNPFGDVTSREGAQPEPIPITIRWVTPDEILALREPLAPDPGLPVWRSLFAVEFPGGQVTATVRLKLGSIESQTHRLLIYTTQPAVSRRVDSGAPQVLTLTGKPPVRSPLPDKPWSTQISLSETYNAPDGAYRRIGLEGSPGGQGRLSLDPNYITVNALGEPGMSTLMGFSPHPVTLNLVGAADPSGLERRLYQVVSDNPRDTNRCFLVPDSFLRDAGVPEEAIELARAIRRGSPILWQSYFIRYAAQDEEFARLLQARMREAHLRVWFAPVDIEGANELHERLLEDLLLQGKLVLVLSIASLQSEWVRTVIRSARHIERRERLERMKWGMTAIPKLRQIDRTDRSELLRVMTEIRKAREKAKEIEKKENWRKLFPIRLVDLDAIRGWTCLDSGGKDLAVEVREYSIPDFSNWKDHDAFESAFKHLWMDLKPDGEKTESEARE
jgi:hypothetical protein